MRDETQTYLILPHTTSYNKRTSWRAWAIWAGVSCRVFSQNRCKKHPLSDGTARDVAWRHENSKETVRTRAKGVRDGLTFRRGGGAGGGS